MHFIQDGNVTYGRIKLLWTGSLLYKGGVHMTLWVMHLSLNFIDKNKHECFCFFCENIMLQC